jgi:hypothetical protein
MLWELRALAILLVPAQACCNSLDGFTISEPCSFSLVNSIQSAPLQKRGVLFCSRLAVSRRLMYGDAAPWLQRVRLGAFVLGHKTSRTSIAERMNSGPDFFTIIKHEHDIRPARAREDSMRNNLSVFCVKPI